MKAVILEALVQALIVRACVGHIDLLCSFCKQGDMVLAAQEVGGIIAVCDLFHGLLVVGVILRIQGDLLHNGFVAGQFLHPSIFQRMILLYCSRILPTMQKIQMYRMPIWFLFC